MANILKNISPQVAAESLGRIKTLARAFSDSLSTKENTPYLAGALKMNSIFSASSPSVSPVHTNNSAVSAVNRPS